MNKYELVQLDMTSIALIDGDRGVNYPNKKDFAENGYCLFLDSSNLTKNGFDFSSKVFINKNKDHAMGKGHLQRGDLVINTRGTIGNIGLYSEDVPFDNVRINSGMLIIRGGADFDNRFLYFYLRSNLFFTQTENLMSGSVQNQLPIWVIKFIKLPKICIKTQQSITEVLSSLDNKIVLNNRINAELDAMAKTLYDYWFVQFDFPDENGKPYKSSGGKMVWNDELKREIPEGWKHSVISEIIDVKDGTHESPKPSSKGYYLITSKHLGKSGIDFKTAYLISENDFNSVNNRSKVDCGDILMSMIGTTDLIYYVQDKNVDFAIKNIGLFKTSQNSLYSEYLYLSIHSVYAKHYFVSNTSGSIQSYLTLNVLRNIPILNPNNETLVSFKNMIQSTFKQIHSNNNQNQTLANLRDWLLPMLMNGQVKVN